MNKLMDSLLKLKVWKDTRGTELIEVALVAGGIAVIAIAVMTPLKTSIVDAFGAIKTALATPAP